MTDATTPCEKFCKTCLNGTRNDDRTVACGAPFEHYDGDVQLPSPIWAVRKRSAAFMMLIMNGGNYSKLKEKYGDDFFLSYNADRMHPLDGETCKMWQSVEP